jgi:uncharacterized membrane protein
MVTQTKLLKLLFTLIIIMLCFVSPAHPPTDSLTLYSTFTKISVAPGESIDYTIDVINNSSEIKNADLSVTGMPKGWNFVLKYGAWNIGQLSVLPGERKSISLKVDVPIKVNKGTYRFKVEAGGLYTLPLVVIISEQGTFKTEFTADQPNMEGNTTATFTFNANLKNRTAEKQLYALLANAPRGWNVAFKSNYQQVTSVNIEPNSTQAITIEIKPPDRSEAGKYKIPISATTNNSSADFELEVVITGSYGMELTTPTGLLSTSITAGEYKQVELVINNTGSSELKGIELNASAPVNWVVTFDPKKVDILQTGKSAKVYATIKADKKAIPGDYITNIDTRTPETSSRASLRISVETPLLWGWIGVLIIIVALGSVYSLFRKYGRR